MPSDPSADFDPTTPDAPSSSGVAPAAPAAPGALALLLLTFVLGSIAATFSVATALYRVPLVVGLSVGLLFGAGVPLFFALRARGSLKRRGLRKLFGRIVLTALVLLFQVTLVAIVVFWVGRSGADHARVAEVATSHFVGDIPVLSKTLRRIGKTSTLVIPGAADAHPTGVDGGPRLVDGGPMVPTSRDAGPAAVPPPGATASADAGPAAVPPIARKPRSDASFQSAALVKMSLGGVGLVFIDVFAEGPTQTSYVDIAGLAQLHWPVALTMAPNGDALVVFGTDAVQRLRPGAPGQPVPGLSANAPIDADWVIHHVISAHAFGGPGDPVLSVVRARRKNAAEGETADALLLVHESKVTVLRRGGDALGPTESQRVARLRVKDVHAGGTFVVAESYSDSGEPVAHAIDGDQYTLTPERLWFANVKAPTARTEVGRTGRVAPTFEDRTIQAFADAVWAGDGSVLFDANFFEAGREGGLFRAKTAQDLAPLDDVTGLRKAASRLAPRTRYLSLVGGGTFGFLARDGALYAAPLKRGAVEKLWAASMRTQGADVREIVRPIFGPSSQRVLVAARIGKGKAHAVVLLKPSEKRADVVLKEGEAVSAQPDLGVVKSVDLALREADPLWR